MAARHERHDPDKISAGDCTYNMSVLEQAEQVLDDAAENMHKVPTLDYVQKVERRSNRNRNVVIAVVSLIAIVALIIGSVAYSVSVRNATQVSVNEAALETYHEAITQLRAKGVPENELPPPPTQPVDGPDVDVNGLVDAASAKVLAEIKNNPAYIGPMGPGGPAGDEGPEGPEGPAGEPCDPASNPACVGPEGAEGSDGEPGTPGDQGPKGDAGEPGQPGADAPRPVSAAFTGDPSNCQYVTTYSDGTQLAAPAPAGMCGEPVPPPVTE